MTGVVPVTAGTIPATALWTDEVCTVASGHNRGRHQDVVDSSAEQSLGLTDFGYADVNRAGGELQAGEICGLVGLGVRS